MNLVLFKVCSVRRQMIILINFRDSNAPELHIDTHVGNLESNGIMARLSLDLCMLAWWCMKYCQLCSPFKKLSLDFRCKIPASVFLTRSFGLCGQDSATSWINTLFSLFVFVFFILETKVPRQSTTCDNFVGKEQKIFKIIEKSMICECNLRFNQNRSCNYKIINLNKNSKKTWILLIFCVTKIYVGTKYLNRYEVSFKKTFKLFP